MHKRYFWLMFTLAASLFIASAWLWFSANAHPTTAPPGLELAAAVWTPFNISDHASTAQTYPEIAANPNNGSFLVVYKDDRNAPLGITSRLVSAAGDVLTETLIYTASFSNNLVPWHDVVFNQWVGNQYMVVWNAGEGGTSEHPQLFGQRIFANGNPIGAFFRIDGDDNNWDYFPTIVQDINHGPLLVVWNERDNTNSSAHVNGKILDGAGQTLVPTFVIGELDGYDNAHPAAAFNTVDSQYLVIWDEWDQTTDVITGQLILPNGALLGDPIKIALLEGSSTDDHAFPDVAYDPHSNQYLVVWSDRVGGNYHIYGQSLAANGAPIGGAFEIAATAQDERRPAIGYFEGENSGAFLVAWDVQRPTPNNTDIFGRWIGPDGVMLGDSLALRSDTANKSQKDPAMAFNARTNQFLVAWDGEGTTDVYGMRISGLPYDLYVRGVEFRSDPHTVHHEEAATLEANIHNRFGQVMQNVEVEFYDGEPNGGGTLIGSKVVNFDAREFIKTVDVTWDSPSPLGAHTLYVTVDPNNLIPEALEGNNQTALRRTVWPPSIYTQAPTGTLTIDGGAPTTPDGSVILTIEAFDDHPLGVQWMYLREWWAAPDRMGVETTYIAGARGSWQHQDTDWIRYLPEYATTGFPYNLMGTPGIHYIQVWLCDINGDTSASPPPIWDSINLLPEYAWTLTPAEWHLYRMGWAPSTTVYITMTVTGDDDALYVWSPGQTGAPDLVSDLPGPDLHAETLSFQAEAGVYQILASGQAPAGGQYLLEWQASGETMLHTPAQDAQATANGIPGGPVLQASETPPVVSSIQEFQAASDIVYNGPWQAIAPGETLTFTHQVGGDPSLYAVELWSLDTESGGLGINNAWYGGDMLSGQPTGVFWWRLTDSTIRVTRGSADTTADQVRVRIWQAETPDWDSGWQSIQAGEANAIILPHGRGGEAGDYMVGIKFQDTDGNLGIHHFALGGTYLGGVVHGAAYRNLTNASVEVLRFGGDLGVDQFRLMIYLPDAANPPDWDSGWQQLTLGELLALDHDLGGNPMSYLLRVNSRSVGSGINNLATGGFALPNGQQRGGYWERLNNSSISLFRAAQDPYAQEMRVRIWLPSQSSIYLPLVTRDAAPSTVELSYDDGESDSEQSHDIGCGFAVRFTPTSTPATLVTGRFYLDSAAGANSIEVHVWDTNHADLITPFQVTPPAGAGWFNVDLSSYHLAVNGDFYLGFLYPAGSYDPSIGVDYDAPLDGRSWEVPWENITHDYMIRAVIQP